MDIRQFIYFSEICRQKSFSGAAEQLYITPQGISMAISRLETELSCKLFRREGKELRLTRQGTFLSERAEEILRQFRICEEYFARERDRQYRNKRISIASAYGVMPEFAGDLVFRFRQKHPDVELRVRENCDCECEEAVWNGTAELGFSIAPFDIKKFDTTKLINRRFCLIVHKTHPLAHKKSSSADVLREMPVMMTDERYKIGSLITDCCRRKGFMPNIQFKAGELMAVHRFVKDNRGAGISVESAAKALAQPDVRAVALDEPRLTWSVCLIKKRGASLSPIAKTFERFVIKQMCSSTEEKTPAFDDLPGDPD